MLLEEGFPMANTDFFDIRIEKEARTLLGAGHELSILTIGDNLRPREEIVNGIRVLRTDVRQTSISPKHLSKMLRFYLTFVDSFWEKALVNAVEHEKPQVLHIHDLAMVKTGLTVARAFNLPVVADLHENYPEGLRWWRRGLKGKVLNLINPIWRWKQIEKSVLQRVDRIIVVVDESREHYIKDCHVPPEKITIVMNVEDEYYAALPVDQVVINRYAPFFTISYIGSFGYHRGIHTAIRAMPEIVRQITNARLVLVGLTGKEANMKNLAEVLGVAKSVEFTGRQPFNLVPSFVAASNICIVPHVASAHTNSTIPHKLFQYMSKGRPVLVSSAKPLARIVTETKAGLVFRSEDAHDFATAVVKIHDDAGLAMEMGKSGEKAVKEKYNWNMAGANLAELYRNLGVTR
jgi:glycosyltransferase involved in cell wall biosynthesis